MKQCNDNWIRYLRENQESSHVDLVMQAVQNLKEVLRNDTRFFKIKSDKGEHETDVSVFVRGSGNQWELVAQLSLNEFGFPVDDGFGSAWYDTRDVEHLIQKYVEKLETEAPLNEEGGDGGGDASVGTSPAPTGTGVGADVVHGEPDYEPMSVRGYTKLSTKKKTIPLTLSTMKAN